MTLTGKSILSLSCALAVSGQASVFSSFTASAASENGLVINEVCAKNTQFAAADGGFYDWIELYNGSSESLDIGGYGISDNESKPYKFTFAEGTTIAQGEHLLVYCNSDDTEIRGHHTAFFGLSAEGETILLTDRDGNTADRISFSAVGSDVSFGRTTDGASEFGIMKMTPGEANGSGEVTEKIVMAPEFSVPSGFYSSSFNLEIKAQEGTKIYFTVDSSTPDSSSIEYTSAISIQNAMNTNKEAQKKPDGGREPGGPEGGGQRPEENHNTQAGSDCAVIRAVAIDSEGRKSEPVTAVYFIGYENKASYYQNWKVISIVTDSENLFSKETGIWQNYEKSGSEWERPANMQIFSSGKCDLDQNIGIRIHGGYSRRFNQKSLNVYARSEYGRNSIDYDLFSGELRSENTGKKIKSFDSFILRNAGNDCQDTRFRDKLNQQLVKDRNFLEQAMEPCIVFINGQFYGHYEITEKLSKDYIKDHTGVSKKDVCIVKNEKLDEGSEETFREFEQLGEWIKKTDLSSDENYKKLCSMVDMDSFIDYMCTEIYIANKDWGKNNMSMWKSVSVDENNPYADGRWRFILFDTEFSSNIYNTVPADINMFSILAKEESFLGNLLSAAMKNQEFKKQFFTAFMDIAGNNFSSDNVNSLINQYSEMYREAATDTQKKFYGNSNFSGAVSTVKNWFGSRYSSAVSHIKKATGLNEVTDSSSPEEKNPQDDHPENNNVSGDVNSDGVVNSSDIISLVSYITGKNTSTFKSNADINGDGKINVTDFILLKNKILK